MEPNSTSSIAIPVNGKPVNFAGGDLLALLQSLQLAERSGLAVAVNDQVIPRADWASMGLTAEDRVTVITATAGG
jgi:sulfur carrier protein